MYIQRIYKNVKLRRGTILTIRGGLVTYMYEKPIPRMHTTDEQHYVYLDYFYDAEDLLSERLFHRIFLLKKFSLGFYYSLSELKKFNAEINTNYCEQENNLFNVNIW
jgi:hypothetical protein